MKREHKYKAFTQEGRMIDVGSIEFFTDGSYRVNDEIPIASGNLLEYTGLKDRNGREIYDGDVVKAYQQIGVVRWHDLRSAFILNDTKLFNELLHQVKTDAEVIGNIHENPELLEP